MKIVIIGTIAISMKIATIELPTTVKKDILCLPVMIALIQVNIAAQTMALLNCLVTMDVPVSISLMKLRKGATTKQTMRKSMMPIPKRKMRIFDGGR